MAVRLVSIRSILSDIISVSRLTVNVVAEMYKRSLILFTFSTGILCNIVTDDIPELNVRGSRSLNDSVTNNIPGTRYYS